MGHRRVHTEIIARYPDEITFGGSMEGGDDEADDLLATYMDMEKIEFFSESPKESLTHHNIHNNKENLIHCIPVDEISGLSSSNDNDFVIINKNNSGVASCETTKKAMPPNKLAELWIADPKRAKRILANRQSAARSKERKARYMEELENRVNSLQTEATALSVQLSLFKRDTNGLTSENIDLRRQVESMQQHAQLRDALNDALKQELDRLKLATGETSTPADAWVMALHTAPHHSQQRQQKQIHPSSGPFKTSMLIKSNQIDSHSSKMSCLRTCELNIPHLSLALGSHQAEILHSSHQSAVPPIEVNMINLPQQPKVQQLCPADKGLFLPFESSMPRMPQFCTTEANMNNYPPQPTGSPLEHLPPYALESNTQSPEQEIYTSKPHVLTAQARSY